MTVQNTFQDLLNTMAKNNKKQNLKSLNSFYTAFAVFTIRSLVSAQSTPLNVLQLQGLSYFDTFACIALKRIFSHKDKGAC